MYRIHVQNTCTEYMYRMHVQNIGNTHRNNDEKARHLLPGFVMSGKDIIYLYAAVVKA